MERYTFSQSARACLHALRTAAWIEAMVVAYRAAAPHEVPSWLWLIVRCALFTLGAHVVVGVASQIARRRAARGAGEGAAADGAATDAFDVRTFEHTAGVLLFHAGTPLWIWIFA